MQLKLSRFINLVLAVANTDVMIFLDHSETLNSAPENIDCNPHLLHLIGMQIEDISAWPMT